MVQTVEGDGCREVIGWRVLVVANRRHWNHTECGGGGEGWVVIFERRKKKPVDRRQIEAGSLGSREPPKHPKRTSEKVGAR